MVMMDTDPRFRKAYEFAKNAHEGQLRESINTPYINHPLRVSEILYSVLNENDNQTLDSDRGKFMIEAALLHDTIEDTSANYETILAIFGKETARLVMELTSDKKILNEYKDRLGSSEGRVEYMSEKIMKMSGDALLVKLADRIHNIIDAKMSEPSFRERYIMETKIIAKNISERISNESKPHQILFGILLSELG